MKHLIIIAFVLAADPCRDCMLTGAGADCRPPAGSGPPSTVQQIACVACVAASCGATCSMSPSASTYCSTRGVTTTPTPTRRIWPFWL